MCWGHQEDVQARTSAAALRPGPRGHSGHHQGSCHTGGHLFLRPEGSGTLHEEKQSLDPHSYPESRMQELTGQRLACLCPSLITSTPTVPRKLGPDTARNLPPHFGHPLSP